MIVKNKRKPDNDKPYGIYPPPSEAQIQFCQGGYDSILPRNPDNLLKIIKDIKETGEFNMEFSFSLKQKESLNQFAQRLQKSAQDGSSVEFPNSELIPFRKRKFFKFNNLYSKIKESLQTNISDF